MKTSSALIERYLVNLCLESKHKLCNPIQNANIPLKTVVPIYVEHWGYNLQFYPIFNIGGDADVDHSQIIAKMQSNYWGGHIPPSIPGFGTPD